MHCAMLDCKFEHFKKSFFFGYHQPVENIIINHLKIPEFPSPKVLCAIFFFGLAVHEMLLKVYSDENEDDDKQRTRFIKTINYSLWLSLLKYSLLLETCIIFICIRSKDPNFNFRFPHLGIRVRVYCNTLLINPYLSLKANILDGPSDETGKPEVVWHYKSPYHAQRP